MDVDGNGEKSTTFRWINVARYAVATVMTVLIATVVVIAFKIVMRPDTLYVKVVGGSISVVTPSEPLSNQIQLDYTLYYDNPSGRAVMYYYNVMAYLFDKNISAWTPYPQRDCFAAIDIGNLTLEQQEALSSISQSVYGPDLMTPSYFDMLYSNRSARIDDVTMRIEGYLVTETFSGRNTTDRWTTYICSPLVVGWAPATTRGGQDDDEAGAPAASRGGQDDDEAGAPAASRGGQDDDEANKNTQGSVFCNTILLPAK